MPQYASVISNKVKIKIQKLEAIKGILKLISYGVNKLTALKYFIEQKSLKNS